MKTRMQEPEHDADVLAQFLTAAESSLCVGHLVEIDDSGAPTVDFPGNTRGPIRARTLVQANGLRDEPEYKTIPVMLTFENRDPSLPIIIGLIRDRIVDDYARSIPDRPTEGILDGKAVVLKAEDEIVLKCGKSSITLRRDGKIVTRGVDVTSRASRINKLKGANVRVN